MDNIIPFDDFLDACKFEINGALERVPGEDFWKANIGRSQWAVFSNLEAKLMGWDYDSRCTGTIAQITLEDVVNGVCFIEINGYDGPPIPVNALDLTRRILDS